MQTKRMSMVEAMANTLSGFVISMCLSWIVMPYYGKAFTWGDSFSFTLIFTIASVLRSYVWRRLFNRAALTREAGDGGMAP